MADRVVLVDGRRLRLSSSRLSVLRHIVDAGMVTSSQDAGLRIAGGTERQSFLALAGLNADGLVRWALGGSEIRATSLGRRVLRESMQPLRRRGR